MARQRFIWPTLWADPSFGHLKPVEQVLFIGLFSNADDEGRLLADPAYLRSTVFPYAKTSTANVKRHRDAIVKACPSVVLYHENGVEYIALTRWKRHQKPKYPKPSTLPAPPTFPEASPNVPGSLEEASPKLSPWVGLGKNLNTAVDLGENDPLTHDPNSNGFDLEETLANTFDDIPL